MSNVVKVFFHFIIILKSFAHSCSCNKSGILTENAVTVNTNLDINLKSETDPEYEDTTAIEEKHTKTVSDNNRTLRYITEMPEVPVNETDTENKLLQINISNKYKSELCFNFKNGADLNFNGMVDVWETKYYQLQDTIPCFKLLIRKTSIEERIQYSWMYYNINNKVNWTNTIMEVVSNALPKSIKRRHFLNGVREDQGILDNIIMLEKDDGNVTMVDESPDQWLVTGNLLLMRDCDNGNVVLFTRFPYEARNQEIVDALLEFGETATTGKMACKTWDKTNVVKEDINELK